MSKIKNTVVAILFISAIFLVPHCYAGTYSSSSDKRPVRVLCSQIVDNYFFVGTNDGVYFDIYDPADERQGKIIRDSKNGKIRGNLSFPRADFFYDFALKGKIIISLKAQDDYLYAQTNHGAFRGDLSNPQNGWKKLPDLRKDPGLWDRAKSFVSDHPVISAASAIGVALTGIWSMKNFYYSTSDSTSALDGLFVENDAKKKLGGKSRKKYKKKNRKEDKKRKTKNLLGPYHVLTKDPSTFFLDGPKRGGVELFLLRENPTLRAEDLFDTLEMPEEEEEEEEEDADDIFGHGRIRRIVAENNADLERILRDPTLTNLELVVNLNSVESFPIISKLLKQRRVKILHLKSNSMYSFLCRSSFYTLFEHLGDSSLEELYTENLFTDNNNQFLPCLEDCLLRNLNPDLRTVHIKNHHLRGNCNWGFLVVAERNVYLTDFRFPTKIHRIDTPIAYLQKTAQRSIDINKFLLKKLPGLTFKKRVEMKKRFLELSKKECCSSKKCFVENVRDIDLSEIVKFFLKILDDDTISWEEKMSYAEKMYMFLQERGSDIAEEGQVKRKKKSCKKKKKKEEERGEEDQEEEEVEEEEEGEDLCLVDCSVGNNGMSVVEEDSGTQNQPPEEAMELRRKSFLYLLLCCGSIERTGDLGNGAWKLLISCFIDNYCEKYNKNIDRNWSPFLDGYFEVLGKKELFDFFMSIIVEHGDWLIKKDRRFSAIIKAAIYLFEKDHLDVITEMVNYSLADYDQENTKTKEEKKALEKEIKDLEGYLDGLGSNPNREAWENHEMEEKRELLKKHMEKLKTYEANVIGEDESHLRRLEQALHLSTAKDLKFFKDFFENDTYHLDLELEEGSEKHKELKKAVLKLLELIRGIYSLRS